MSEEISPLAKRLAEENNVNWRRLEGSGPDGRVVERDVLEYLARVMSGEEDTDPTPEPTPDGLEAWPEEDVGGFGARESAAGAAAEPEEDFGDDFGDLDEWGEEETPEEEGEIGDDIFLFDDEDEEDELIAEPEADTAEEEADIADEEELLSLSFEDEEAEEEALVLGDEDDFAFEDEDDAFAFEDEEPAAAEEVALSEEAATEEAMFDTGEEEAFSFEDEEAEEAPPMLGDEDDFAFEDEEDAFALEEDAPEAAAAEEAFSFEDETAEEELELGAFDADDTQDEDALDLGGFEEDDAEEEAFSLEEDDEEDTLMFGEEEDLELPEPDVTDSSEQEAALDLGAFDTEDRDAEDRDAEPVAGEEPLENAFADTFEDELEDELEDEFDDALAEEDLGTSEDELEEAGLEGFGDEDLTEELPADEDFSAEPFAEEDFGAEPATEDALPPAEPEPVDEDAFADDLADEAFDVEPEPEPEPEPAPAAVPAAPSLGKVPAGDRLPLVSYGLLLRRQVDLSAVEMARADIAHELHQDEVLAPTAFVLRAAAKALRGTSLGGEPSVALAVISEDGVGATRVRDAHTMGFIRLHSALQEIRASQPDQIDKVALAVADMSHLNIDEAVLNLGVPVLTLGRVTHDKQQDRYFATLSLSGEVAPEQGSKFLSRVVELLEHPMRLIV